MQQGFTLSELMVALSIGMTLTAVLCGLVQFFWGMQSQADRHARWWRQSLTVGEQIVSAVHQAGFAGCVRPLSWGSPVRINAAHNELIVVHASRQNATLIRSQNDPQLLFLSRELVFQVGDDLLINNCLCIEQFSVKKINFSSEGTQSIMPDHHVKCLPLEAEVYRVDSERFFVGRDKTTGGTALYQQVGHHPARMLADNITGFRINDECKEGQIRGIRACIRSEVARQPQEWCIFASLRNR